MSAHTPGPWEWSGRWLVGKGKMILWYTTADDGVHANPEDARLIAAAPDLLEALVEISECPEIDALDMKRIADAAIAKAVQP